jgi:predicted small lipoprotein YifL
MNRFLRLALVGAALLLAAALGACGKKGPLYLPQPPAAPHK